MLVLLLGTAILSLIFSINVFYLGSLRTEPLVLISLLASISGCARFSNGVIFRCGALKPWDRYIIFCIANASCRGFSTAMLLRAIVSCWILVNSESVLLGLLFSCALRNVSGIFRSMRLSSIDWFFSLYWLYWEVFGLLTFLFANIILILLMVTASLI